MSSCFHQVYLGRDPTEADRQGQELGDEALKVPSAILTGYVVNPEVGHEVNHVVNQKEVHEVNRVVNRKEVHVHVPVVVSALMGLFAFAFFVWAPVQHLVESLEVEVTA